MALLLTWSDRGRGAPLAHHGKRPATDRGPVLRLLAQPESAGWYERALVLTTDDGLEAASMLAREMRAFVPEVTLEPVALRDPSDYAEVFQAVRPWLGRLPRTELDVVLSAGTPQMQTIWFVLVASGMLPARMLQVVPADFVPVPHPKAIREIELDIEGFPEIRALRDEVERLRAERAIEEKLIGQSEPMRTLRSHLARVARSEVPVLVRGETGTGKELIARALHEQGPRRRGPFVAENCAAFSESVLASELFGHEKGAFTGAAGVHRGVFERAHGGTLFLDEVGELGPRVQASLLRVLQEGTLRRLGGEGAVRVDVRVIVATHRDLRAMVATGAFREDLYYRLRGAELIAPPLRERASDLEGLVEAFLAETGRTLRVTREALRAMAEYGWPGNVRELRAEVLRWTIYCDRLVRLADLSPEIRGEPVSEAPRVSVAPALRPLAEVVEEVERRAIEHALSVHEGNLSQTARALAIDRNTLKRKLAAWRG
jgi:DNA-binding NtrC family response regulator